MKGQTARVSLISVRNFRCGNPVHVIPKGQQSNAGPGKSRVRWRELILKFAWSLSPTSRSLIFKPASRIVARISTGCDAPEDESATMQSEISIIVPFFNEVDNVAPLAGEILAALKDEPRAFELVFVDDASTDGTWEQIMAAHRADPRVRGLRHSRNAGQSAALWSGFRGSRSPIIMTLDGDRQNDPADLPRLLAGLAQYDLCSGNRANRQASFLRLVSARIGPPARTASRGLGFLATRCRPAAIRGTGVC